MLNGQWVDLAHIIITYGINPIPSLEGYVAQYHWGDYLGMYDTLVRKRDSAGNLAKLNELRSGIALIDTSNKALTLTKYKHPLNLKDT